MKRSECGNASLRSAFHIPNHWQLSEITFAELDAHNSATELVEV